MSTSAAWTWQDGSTSGLLGNDFQAPAGVNSFYFLIWLVLYPFECQYFILGHYRRILHVSLPPGQRFTLRYFNYATESSTLG